MRFATNFTHYQLKTNSLCSLCAAVTFDPEGTRKPRGQFWKALEVNHFGGEEK